MHKFPENKTTDHFQAGQCRPQSRKHTLHNRKGSNMVAATKSKCHFNCACHCLSTLINTAWDASESQELKELDDYANSPAKIESGGIHYQLH